MTSREHDIGVLSTLIAATLDSVDGFDQAWKGTTNPQVRSLFAKRAVERKHVTAELQLELRRLGGSPGERHSHAPTRPSVNAVVDLMQNDRSVVRLVTAGEEALKQCYGTALADPALSPKVRNLTHRAYDVIKTGGEEMHNLKRLAELG